MNAYKQSLVITFCSFSIGCSRKMAQNCSCQEEERNLDFHCWPFEYQRPTECLSWSFGRPLSPLYTFQPFAPYSYSPAIHFTARGLVAKEVFRRAAGAAAAEHDSDRGETSRTHEDTFVLLPRLKHNSWESSLLRAVRENRERG